MAERNALVIGCSDYKQLSKLKNPINDAYAMVKALENVGFTVLCSPDDTKILMIEAIDEFSRRIREKESKVALIYYSGHGIQVKGENYLIPIDTESAKIRWIENTVIPLSKIFHFIQEAKNETNILILDACRDNPFYSEHRGDLNGGFSERTEVPNNTIVSFATGAGEKAGDGIGDNSVYVSKLLSILPKPGLKAVDVFMEVGREVIEYTKGAQHPTMNVNLYRDFFFVPPQKRYVGFDGSKLREETIQEQKELLEKEKSKEEQTKLETAETKSREEELTKKEAENREPVVEQRLLEKQLEVEVNSKEEITNQTIATKLIKNKHILIGFSSTITAFVTVVVCWLMVYRYFEIARDTCEKNLGIWNGYNCTVMVIKPKKPLEPDSGSGKWSTYQGQMKWDEASKKCVRLGMKLPTIKELEVAYAVGITKSWEEKGILYWSSTPYGKDYAYFLKILDGTSDTSLLMGEINVRCIR